MTVTDLEKAAYVAENVLEWCKPIGQYNHMAWYQDAGKEIAGAIRTDLERMYRLSLSANDGEITFPTEEQSDAQ